MFTFISWEYQISYLIFFIMFLLKWAKFIYFFDIFYLRNFTLYVLIQTLFTGFLRCSMLFNVQKSIFEKIKHFLLMSHYEKMKILYKKTLIFLCKYQKLVSKINGNCKLTFDRCKIQ